MKIEFLSSSPDCEILTTRIVNFPRELVYRAWTDPEHLKNWWGPAGFTNTFKEFDLRIGGKWIFVMHGPGNGNYVNECEFIKIEEPELVAWKRYSKPLFQVVAAFEEVTENSTKIIFRQIFDSEGECNKIKKYTFGKNDENFDKLEVELSKMNTNRTATGDKNVPS